jgi:imidazolonepropionase-like amidohydrolase
MPSFQSLSDLRRREALSPSLARQGNGSLPLKQVRYWRSDAPFGEPLGKNRVLLVASRKNAMARIARVVIVAALIATVSWSPARAGELAIVGATVYTAPDAEPIERGTVLLRDGRIAAVGAEGSVRVPDGATRLDASGGAVVAGFWNSHVHVLALPLREAASRSPAELNEALQATFLRWGFTTVFDIGSIPGTAFALRRRVEAGELTGPKILTADAPFFPKGGTPVYVADLFREAGAKSMEVTGEQDARSRALQQLSEGADGVKLFAGAIVRDGVVPMDEATATAIVQAAHRAGKPAFAHPTNLQGLEVSIASGVDILAHTTPTSGAWSPAFARRLVAASMALTPTLSLFEAELTKEAAPPEVVQRFDEASRQQVVAFVAAGGELLFGTDVGYVELADTRREFQLMAAAGLDWRAVLASLTTSPARRFGYADRKGRIAAGLDADLVVLFADPARNATAFADVRYTIRDGKVIYRAAAPPAR